MTSLDASRSLATHLTQKGLAMHAAARARPQADDWHEVLEVRCVADDVTGVRKLTIRDWEFLGDGGPDIGGWNLGPSSPEYLLGVISTCLTHTILCLAGWRGISLDRVEVRVRADNNDSRFFGIDGDHPAPPHNIQITVELEAQSMTKREQADFIAEAEATCPIVQALRLPTDLRIVIL